MLLTSNTNNPFIISKNSPRVTIVIGKVSNTKIGFTNALIIESTTATTRAVKKLAIATPGNVYAATKTATV